MPIVSAIASATARALGFTSEFFYDAPVPSLFLDFASTTTLDSRITFTRATSATYFDSAGVLQTASSGVARFDHRLESGVWVNKGLLIEEQKTNRCLQSENFATTWVTSRATVSSNSSTAPDGNTTADSLIEDGATGSHTTGQASISIVANRYVTASCYIKALGVGAQRWVRFQLQDSTGASGGRALFDIDNGTLAIPAGNFGSGSGATSSITAVGNGWYRCTCSTIIDASTTSMRFDIFLQNQGVAYLASYTGDNTSGAIFWGAQVEIDPGATSYVATTTTAVTRNADVAVMTGTDFSSWFNSTEGTIYSLADGQNPEDANAFDVLFQWVVSDNSNVERLQNAHSFSTGVNRLIFSGISSSTAQFTLTQPLGSWSTTKQYALASAYKSNDFAFSGDGATSLTQSSGTVPTVDRIYFGANATGGGFFLNGHIAEFAYWPTRLPNTGLQFLSKNGYDNDGLTLILNFDQTTVLDPRITFTRATSATYFDSSGVLQTASSGVARFDHRLEGGVWVNKGLLIEEQRTNLALQSEAFTNTSYWSLIRGTSSADQETAPDGTTTADKFLESTDTGQHGFTVFGGIVQSASTSSNYSFSCFVKDIDRGYCYVQLTYQNSGSFVNGAVVIGEFSSSTITTTTTIGSGTLPTNISGTMTNVGNGWFRITISTTSPSTGINQVRPVVGPASNGTTFSYTGDITKGAYVWGAQLEAGAFPTSYIKTTTASVTRNADQASMTGTDFSSWYNATEGTLFNQFACLGDISSSGWVAARIVSISDDTLNERIQLTVNNTPSIGGLVSDGGVIQANFTNTPSSTTANTTYKYSFAYKANDFADSLDGATVNTDTSGSLPSPNRVYIGASPVSGTTNFLNGHLAKFYYWNTRKSNSFLQSITG